MLNSSTYPVRNRVILSIRPDAQAFIAARWQVRSLELGEVIYREGEVFTHAVFPHFGALSLLSATDGGKSVETASIGDEGFLGFTYLMGGVDALNLTVVQVPGYASWLSIDDLQAAMERFVCVREAMLRYSKALIVQLMETVRCNSLHSAEQRVSRWLLHADDRVKGEDFLLTQESLAQALGLRRATVSEICSRLMQSGAIAYSRGTVSIFNRKTLRAHACECYDRITAASMPLIS